MSRPDVMMLNGIGPGFTGHSVRSEGIGGSELEIVQIAEALVARGHSVVVANGVVEEVEAYGVLYVPVAKTPDHWPTKSLYVERMTRLDDGYSAPGRAPPTVVIRATDVMCSPYDVHREMLESGRATLVGVSRWQVEESGAAGTGFQFAKKRLVIPPMLGAVPSAVKQADRYVYVSNPVKGLQATIDKWMDMKSRFPVMKGATLAIVVPGYTDGVTQRPPIELSAAHVAAGITYEGAPTAEEYRRAIATASALFFVNTFTETFCCAAALAELAGTRRHILLRSGWGGIQEALRYTDGVTEDEAAFEADVVQRRFRKETAYSVTDRSPGALVRAWEDALGLTATRALCVPVEVYQVPRERADIPTPGWDGWAGGGRAHRFWLTPRILVGGAILSAADGETLKATYGITHVLSAESERHDRDKGFAADHLCRIPFVDNGVNGPTEAQVHEALDFAERVMADPAATLYAHCQLGGSRGPSMGYLVATGVLGADPDTVVEQLRGVHIYGERLHAPYRASIDAGIASWRAKRAALDCLLAADPIAQAGIAARSAATLPAGWEDFKDTVNATPKPDEATVARELRERLVALADPADTTVTDYWRGRCAVLATLARQHAATDPGAWLSWSNDVDHQDDPVFQPWYDTLVADPAWATRWGPLSRNPKHGVPHAFARDAGTSPVPMQHTYHLRTYERADAGRRFLDGIDVIVEVGGGYGNFCRMLRADGYRGPHYIIDLPHTREFQRANLSLCGIPYTYAPEARDGASLVLERDIPAVLAQVAGKRVGFVATWSLSETPIAFRDKLFPALHPHVRKYLMATQWPSHCMEQHISNADYFTAFASGAMALGRHFALIPVPDFPHNAYLFGADRPLTVPATPTEVATTVTDQTAAGVTAPATAAVAAGGGETVAEFVGKVTATIEAEKAAPAAASVESHFNDEALRLTANQTPFPQYYGEFMSALKGAIAPGGSEFGLGISLFSLVVSTRAANVVEIGRFKGFSTLALASGLRLIDAGWVEPKAAEQRPDVDYVKHTGPQKRQLYSIDPSPLPEVPALLEKYGLTSYVRLVDAPSQNVKLEADSAIDVLFVDGDHTYEGCRRDVERFVPHVKPGGYFVLHDMYGWFDASGNNGSPIKRVADEVLKDFEQVLIDTGFASFKIFRKTTDMGASVKACPPRADGRPTVGLAMIAKNESQVLGRALMSAKKLGLDAMTVLVAAESHDQTADLARELGADVVVRPTPKADYDTGFGFIAGARNQLLSIAERKTDYLLMLDPDDWFEGELPKVLDQPAYAVTIHDSSVRYLRTQLFRGKLGMQYEGIRHEVLNQRGHEGRHIDGLRYMRGHGGWQDQVPPAQKYLAHARDLEKWVIDHPDDPRAVYYTAQSHKDASSPRAREWYERRAAMTNGWDEERFVSAWELARLDAKSNDVDPVPAFIKAHELRPTRAEPLFELAMYLRDDLRKRFTLAYLFARRAAELSQPNDGLFVDAEVYTWKAAAEAGICAYWANDRVSAVRYFEAIQAKVPAEKREWAAQTLAVCRRDAQPPQARP